MIKANLSTTYSEFKAHMLPGCSVDCIFSSTAEVEVQPFSLFLFFCLPMSPGILDIILLFPLTLYSWLFNPAKKCPPLFLTTFQHIIQVCGSLSIINVLVHKSLKYLLCYARRNMSLSAVTYISAVWMRTFCVPGGSSFIGSF